MVMISCQGGAKVPARGAPLLAGPGGYGWGLSPGLDLSAGCCAGRAESRSSRKARPQATDVVISSRRQFEASRIRYGRKALMLLSDRAHASSSRITCVALHLPPRAAGMPRSSRPAAMAGNATALLACSCLIAGVMSAARSLPNALPSARCEPRTELAALPSPYLAKM